MKFAFATLLNFLVVGALLAQNQPAVIKPSCTFHDPLTGKQIGPTYEMANTDDNGNSIVCDGCQYSRNSWGGFENVGGKWGVVNANGEVVIPLEYSNIQSSSSRYYVVEKGDSKGLIDYRGEVIAKPIYKELYIWGMPDYWIAKNDAGNFGMVAGDGKVLFDFEYDDINVENGYALVTNEKGMRVFDLQGKQILQSYFDKIELINNKNLYFKTEKGTKVQLLDSKGNVIIENKGLNLFYSSGYELVGFQISNGRNLGLVDFNGKQILPTLYSEILPYKIEDKDYYLVTLNKKKGLLDKNGKVVIPIKYDFLDTQNFGKYVVVSNSGEWKKQSEYDETIAFTPNKYEFIDLNTKKSILQVEDYIISTIDYSDYFLLTKKGTNWGVLNSELKEVLPFDFSSIQVSNSLLVATKGAKVEGDRKDWSYSIEGGVWGAYNKKYELLLPFEYEKIEDDGDYTFGIKVVKSNLIGFVNQDGKTVIKPQFSSLGKCSNNSCVFSIRDIKTSDLNYGTIDRKSGKVLLQAKYSDLKSVQGSNLYIAKNGKQFGVINESGKIVLDIKYSYLQALNSSCYLTNEFGEVQGSYVYGGKFGIMSLDGNTILKNDYEKIEFIYDNDSLLFCDSNNGATRKLFNLKTKSFVNTDGFESVIEVHETALVVANNLVTDEYGYVVSGNLGVVSKSGKVLIPGNYSNIFVQKNYIVAVDSLNNKSDFFNINGQQIFNDFSKVIALNDTLVVISEKGSENYVYNAKSQKNIFNQSFSDITPVLSYARQPRFVVEKDGKLGVIDIQGKEIVPFSYCTIQDVESGDYFIVGTCVNFDSGSVPKFGVINKYGNTILNMEYDSIRSAQNYPLTFICLKNGIESEHDIYDQVITK